MLQGHADLRAMRRLLLCFASFAISCAPTVRNAAWSYNDTGFQDVSDAVLEGLIHDGDVAYAARGAQLGDAVANYSAALRQRPADVSILYKLGLARFQRGRFNHYKKEDDLDRHKDFAEAIACAERAMSLSNADMRARATSGKVADDVFVGATVKDVPLMIFYAEALLSWAESYGRETVELQSAWIKAAVERSLALNRSIAFGAPDRLDGILIAQLPAKKMGGCDAALPHFKSAIAIAPDYLPNRLALAKLCLTQKKDRAERRRMLSEIISVHIETSGEMASDNYAAQAEAKKLLAKRD